MKDDGEGLPLCGPSARMLGVRLVRDLRISARGIVQPRAGGMSVAVGSPRNLPRHRRPPAQGGIGPDPVWRIEVDDLPDALVFRADPECPTVHGLIEPSRPMLLGEYQEALAVTRSSWSRV